MSWTFDRARHPDQHGHRPIGISRWLKRTSTNWNFPLAEEDRVAGHVCTGRNPKAAHFILSKIYAPRPRTVNCTSASFSCCQLARIILTEATKCVDYRNLFFAQILYYTKILVLQNILSPIINLLRRDSQRDRSLCVIPSPVSYKFELDLRAESNMKRTTEQGAQRGRLRSVAL